MSDSASKIQEADFIRALCSRDEEAYRRLFSTYSDKLYRAIYRILNNEQEAQECLQDLFVKVISKISTFKGDSTLSTWLYRIAVNEALMKIRAQKKRSEIHWDQIGPHFVEGVMVENIPDWAGFADEMLIKEEGRRFIQQCIDELPEDYKMAYLLKDVEQLSEEEVVDILEISKAVMKIRVHRARLFLRKRIEEKYVTRN